LLGEAAVTRPHAASVQRARKNPKVGVLHPGRD
jgi:hypothetical protein